MAPGTGYHRSFCTAEAASSSASRKAEQCISFSSKMGILKGLFLGVYASNGAIRLLFLPLCYLLLSSPFLLVFARYYGFDSRLLELFGKDRSIKEIALQVFVGLIAASLPTRLLSGRNWSQEQNGGTRRVQQLPYWIPGLRHWGSIVFGGEGWLKNVRYVGN